MSTTPIIPGRGLNQKSAIDSRLEFLEKEGKQLTHLVKHNLSVPDIDKNIESFIGSVEIPLGIVGPLLFSENETYENVYTAAGTLEGALVASMNRGARAISMSGGFEATVKHKRMLRAPMFLFASEEHALLFEKWMQKHFNLIKEEAQNHSNHAQLLHIDTHILGSDVHACFMYTTGDASGQNMTTTCTWHATLWIVERFQKESGIAIEHFVLEGNYASDKKISEYTIANGRGVHVTASAVLKDIVIQKVLRTTARDLLHIYSHAEQSASHSGMVGFNINIANAIAAIFVATGQDLASIHESSHGWLRLTEHEEGLMVQVEITNLVIGSVGGGTHLPKQREALELLGCYGTGKVERFAKLIAGFALSLEISTLSAMVSGAFAKAHEKLGRNKPVQWLTKSELTSSFVKQCLVQNDLLSAEFNSKENIDNGIITEITNKVTSKLIGFHPVRLMYADKEVSAIVKSKALDIEVVKGLHVLAGCIDSRLADLLSAHKENLEYWGCHRKELAIYEALHKHGFTCIPQYFGNCINESREIYLLFMERLNSAELQHINSQKTPEVWTSVQIENSIRCISEVHKLFLQEEIRNAMPVEKFFIEKSIELYRHFVKLMQQDADSQWKLVLTEMLASFFDDMDAKPENIPLTIIHNDFNSRNIAIRSKHDMPCIYDWELAVVNIPHRDIVEFLSFVLPEEFSKDVLMKYLNYHFTQFSDIVTCSKEEWFEGYLYSLKEFLLTRVSFYEVAGIQAKYAFSERVFKVAMRMVELLDPIK